MTPFPPIISNILVTLSLEVKDISFKPNLYGGSLSPLLSWAQFLASSSGPKSTILERLLKVSQCYEFACVTTKVHVLKAWSAEYDETLKSGPKVTGDVLLKIM